MSTSAAAAPTGTLTWLRLGTSLFLDAMGRLRDEELSAPTGLPGWSRKHLLGHVGFNARALQRLVHWARTGEPTPMYASPEQRAAEIEDGATWDGARLRAFVTDSAAELAADLDALDDAGWRAEVVTAQGRTVAAEQIPWMRIREVVIHAVDLGSGVAFADLPANLCEAIVDDVVVRRSGVRRDPPIVLHSTTGRAWDVAGDESDARDAVVVTGAPAQLAQWLTGRGSADLRTADGAPAPALTAWL